jgi:hypothetical protein
MNSSEFGALLRRLTEAAEAGDGAGFAACFTADGLYRDYIYGDHRGRAEIAHMLAAMFHRDAAEYRWQMFDPVCDGAIGYAWSLSTFVSKIPEFAGKRIIIDGMSHFTLRDGLIAEYRESVNGGVAMVQLGVAAPRLEKVLRRWSSALAQRHEVQAYLSSAGNPRGAV